MFALLGGAVLLCLFCPPFKKLWAWIDEHILSQETRPIAIDIIYAVIAGLMLLHHFYVLLYYPTIPAGASKLAPIWIVLAALTVLLGKSWREVGFRIVAIFLIYTFERLYAKNLTLTGNDTVYFFSAIYAFFICLGVFSALRPSVRKPFLQVLCAIWTLIILVLSIAGLFTSWTGILIKNLAEATIHIREGRLELFSTATITAGVLSSGSIMALIGFAISKHKSVKTIFLLSALIIMIANSLTDCRSSFIMLAFFLAGMLSIGIWTIYRNKEAAAFPKGKTLLVIIALLLCFGICFYSAVEGQRYLGIRFIEIRDNGGLLPAADAEGLSTEAITTPPPPVFEQRDIWITNETDINHSLTGRYQIWQNGIQYIQNHPDTLISGLSIDGSVAPIVGRPDHCHNILFQTLLEGGVLSLFLYLILVFYSVFHAFRLWNRRGIPFWQRVLPLPVFSILLWEMAECLTHFSYGHPPMTLFWLFLGATITVSKSLGKAPKSPEIPAESAESINRE